MSRWAFARIAIEGILRLAPYCNTLTRNKNIIALTHFRTNTANYCTNTGLISTRAMFGIKKPPTGLTRTFSAWLSRLIEFLGRCPRLRINIAPLALP